MRQRRSFGKLQIVSLWNAWNELLPDSTLTMWNLPCYNEKTNGGIPIYSFQFNWWNVTRFDLRYNVNTEERIVEYRVEHTELEESGRKSAPIIWEGSYPLEEHWTEVSVCSP